MKTHGMFGTKIYSSWSAMLYRCRNPKCHAYKNYGGRGIQVCERWLEFTNFYADMGSGHWDGAQLDRVDPNGNYEPENCRWVTPAQNQRNRRSHKQVTYAGKDWSLPELCQHLGVSRRHVNSRLAIGWDLEKALETPVKVVGAITITVGGECMTLKRAAAKYGPSRSTINCRLLRGWSPEESVGLISRGCA